jgi:hypothetical protein
MKVKNNAHTRLPVFSFVFLCAIDAELSWLPPNHSEVSFKKINLLCIMYDVFRLACVMLLTSRLKGQKTVGCFSCPKHYNQQFFTSLRGVRFQEAKWI